jgi:DNA recombination protein RmuC
VIGDLRDTTGDLKNALASNSGRGQWGERMAEDVLRLAGMIEGINYIKQTKLEAGSKPDFTFLLPQNLRLNMDVKFPFNNYQQYVSAASDVEREDYKKKFLKDVRMRVKEIQTRDYINPEDQTVDYVLLFVPNEQIFGFINEIDRDLIDEAMKAKTILCSPLSLYAILSVIRQSIDNFRMESKSREMLSHFGTFKDQWGKFKEQMEKVERQLGTVSESYRELTGAREKQLERPLQKIEDLRLERGINAGAIEEAFEKAASKQIISEATVVPGPVGHPPSSR